MPKGNYRLFFLLLLLLVLVSVFYFAKKKKTTRKTNPCTLLFLCLYISISSTNTLSPKVAERLLT